MKKVLIVLIVLIVIMLMVSCTNASKANIKSYGSDHTIKMYNGGVLVAEWVSAGKVSSMKDSDGWQFMDKNTRKLVRVGGDVIIEVK